MPFLHERRCDETNGRRVEAIGGHDQETQNQNQPLIRREKPFIDKSLHVERAVPLCHVGLLPCLLLCSTTRTISRTKPSSHAIFFVENFLRQVKRRVRCR